MRMLLRPGRSITPPAEAASPGFDFPVQLVGTTDDDSVTVYYDPALGPQGLANAKDLLASAKEVYSETSAWFGIADKPVNAIIAALDGSTDGSSGAYHYGCDFDTGGNLYLDADFADSEMVIGLFEAELNECFQGAAETGWNCGGSGGEALSRFLAEEVTGGAKGTMAPYSTAPSWDAAGRPNWIDQDQGTDGDYPSIGCGMVYLSWMIALDYPIEQIVKAGGATLAANYKALTGKDTAWADLTAAVAGMVIEDDDPFSSVPPSPRPQPQPGPTPEPPLDEVKAMIENAMTNLQAALDLLSGKPTTARPFP